MPNQFADGEVEMTDVEANTSAEDTPEETEEDASFWGGAIRPPSGWPNLAISPGQWARSISPSGWPGARPSCVATSVTAPDDDGDENMDDGEEEEDDDEDEDNESDAGAEMDAEAEGEDEWELFGHR